MSDDVSDAMTGVAGLRALSLFDGLDDAQLGQLLGSGEERAFGAGEELFVEGRPAEVWWVLLDGEVQLSRRVGDEDTPVAVMSAPGQWAGGFRAWDRSSVYFASARGASPGRVLAVPTEALRTLADEWFPFGVHFIRGLVDTVRRVESTARQREALVALGTLAAGLAHEINNPASAATRAVDALSTSSDQLLVALTRLAQHGITAQQFVSLDDLRRDVGTSGRDLDAMARADLEEELSTWLQRRGVGQDWLLAPVLAGAGADRAWCERVHEVLGDEALEAGLEWVVCAVAVSGQLAEVKEATRRVSDLVGAVRSYSQLDRGSVQRTDVTEGLDSTLAVLGHKLGAGVLVERDYDPATPQVEAVPGELNQVWTNLIDNAIDAMDGQGTLALSARPGAGGGVVVEITDSGSGMPEEVRAHAFEPFFTTKDVGRGTGLGLDISRRIVVDRHSGDITIESAPGRTVLRVALPARGVGSS